MVNPGREFVQAANQTNNKNVQFLAGTTVCIYVFNFQNHILLNRLHSLTGIHPGRSGRPDAL